MEGAFPHDDTMRPTGPPAGARDASQAISVRVQAAPLLEHHQRPQAQAVIAVAASVLGDEAAHFVDREQIAAAHDVVVQPLVDHAIEIATHPYPHRAGEAEL